MRISDWSSDVCSSDLLTWQAASEETRIILDARATARRGDHLQIEIGALFQPLRLQQSSLGGKFLQSFRQFEANSLHRLLQRGPRRHMMAVGKNLHIIQCRDLPASQRIEFSDLLDFIAEEADQPGRVLIMRSEEHTSEPQSLMRIPY